METKHTKEYAEKMADSFAKTYGGGRSIYIAGYMDAIKQTAAPELLEALIEAKLQIEYLHENFRETGSGNAVLSKINNAIKKATE